MSVDKDVNTTKHSAFSSRPVRNRAVSLGTCAMHVAPATMKDALGQGWCDACKARYDLINYGHAHHWPALDGPPYSIAEGQYFWVALAVMARTDIPVLPTVLGILGVDGYATDDVDGENGA